MADDKEYIVAIGFNIVIDREGNPEGLRYEPSNKRYSLSELPQEADVQALIKAGALVRAPARKAKPVGGDDNG